MGCFGSASKYVSIDPAAAAAAQYLDTRKCEKQESISKALDFGRFLVLEGCQRVSFKHEWAVQSELQEA